MLGRWTPSDRTGAQASAKFPESAILSRLASCAAGAHAELRVGAREVRLDRVHGDEQRERDLLVRRPCGREPRDLLLGLGELARSARGLRPPTRASSPRASVRPAGRAERVEARRGRLERVARRAHCRAAPLRAAVREQQRAASKRSPSRSYSSAAPALSSSPPQRPRQRRAAPPAARPRMVRRGQRRSRSITAAPRRLAELDERLDQVRRDRERARLVDALALAVRPDGAQVLRRARQVAREQRRDAERAGGPEHLPAVVARLGLGERRLAPRLAPPRASPRPPPATPGSACRSA